MPDLPSPRKPPRRVWLYGPYVVLLVVIAAWSAAWLAIRHTAIERLDQAAAGLRAEGWTVEWASRKVGGYPFRLNLRLQAPHIAEPSGWGLSAPSLNSEAYAYAPGHWVILAPDGVTVTRPGAGAVILTGPVLRASVTQVAGQSIPELALEARGLSAAPQPGALPLAIGAADRFAFYLRPLTSDRAEFQLQLDHATPSTGGLLARISAQRPLALVWDETVSHASALNGRDWPSTVRRWSQAGGALSLVHGQIDAGGMTLNAPSGTLAVDASGHIAGDLALDLSHADGAAARLSGAGLAAALAHTDLTLEGGKARLGPFVVGKAPRVY